MTGDEASPTTPASADDATESQLAELVRAAAAVAVPDAVRAAVINADRPDAGPQPGELWRGRPAGGSAVTLMWIRSLTPAGPLAVPVSFDTESVDDDTAVVPGDASPLGLPLAVHLGAETTVDPRALMDRLGSLAPAHVEAAGVAAAARRATEPMSELGEVPGEDGWWPLEISSARAGLLKALHQALGETHPGARIAPRPSATAGSELLGAVALVAELDAFVLVASLDRAMDDAARLEAARQALHADQLLSAVCVVEPADPYLAVVIDRRDVVAAIETPSGQLRPPRHTRPPAPVGVALAKFLDATISPFGRLARTFVEGQAVDPRQLAVDVSADAVRTIHAAAKSYKTEGKRPGYERVKRHQAAITRLVEQALNRADIDVTSILGDDGE